MKMRPIAYLCAVVAIAPIMSLSSAAQQNRAGRADEAARRTWRETMKRTVASYKGCFKASYPSTEWRRVDCAIAPNIPLTPATGSKPLVVGNGTDYSATVSSGLVSSAEGSFPFSTGISSESGYIGGVSPSYSNSFTLQLNSRFFSGSPACSGAANPSTCLAWQQFVYGEGNGTGGAVFMQYWLINYATTCPAGWNTYSSDCWKNSSATSVPSQQAYNIPYMTLTGNASGTNDSVVFTAPGDDLSATGGDSVLDLDSHWTVAEFNVFGDGGGGEANFNSGSTLFIQTSVNNGTTNAPSCPSSGYTGETNNLTIAPLSTPVCCPYGGSKPGIQFMESNVSGATTSCSAGGGIVVTDQPSNSSSYMTEGSECPTIEFTETLYDSTPGADIYWEVSGSSGTATGGYPLSSGDSFNLEYLSCTDSGPSGSMYAAAPGYLPSSTVDIDF